MSAKCKKVSLPRLALLGGVLVAIISGCTSVGVRPGSSAQDEAQAAPSGADLWARTCNRCHNFRSPDSLSDAQWSLVVRHMRIRANLTGEEERSILSFLQSGN